MRIYVGVALLSGLAWLIGSSSDAFAPLAGIGLIFFVISVSMLAFHLIRQGNEGNREL